MIVQSGLRITHMFHHIEKLAENIVVVLLLMKSRLILHIKRLTHIQSVQPDLIRVNILVPEISLAGARHLLDLAVYKINRFAVFFFSGQIVEFKQGFPRIDIVDI